MGGFQRRRKFLLSKVNCHDAGITTCMNIPKPMKKNPKDNPNRVFIKIVWYQNYGTERLYIRQSFTVYCAKIYKYAFNTTVVLQGIVYNTVDCKF